MTVRSEGKEAIINDTFEVAVEGIPAGESPVSPVAEVNKPVLAGMQPVRWEGTVEDTSITEDSSNWYAYVAGDNATDSRDSMWANAKSLDGSYWVWIPRYAYKITEKPENASPQLGSGKIEVVFLSGTTNEYNDNGTMKDAVADGYMVHPAFTFGGTELTGMWVAKYEASHSDAATAVTGTTAPAAGSSVDVKIVPNVTSWRTIQLANMFENCYKMGGNSIYGWTGVSAGDTHMMKPIEWGAVAYLAHSQYGRNRNEVMINSNTNYITGTAAYASSLSGSAVLNAVTDTTSVTGTFPYDNEYRGTLASTTGNIYGIYDMSGGSYEYVLGNLTGYKTNAGTASTIFNSIYDGSDSNLKNKYFDFYAYSGTTSTMGRLLNYNLNLDKKGDCTVEISTSGEGNTSWFSGRSIFLTSSESWLAFSGLNTNGEYTGTFSFIADNGRATVGTSFRPVLAATTE